MDEQPVAGERIRVRLDLAYDGTAFSGWARQPGLRTVQGELERALALVCGGEPALTVAGRTDAGVHATGQVAHVDLDAAQLRAASQVHDRDVGVGALAARLTGLLADGDVVVHRAALAPDGFDARFAAAFRRYRYRVADSLAARDPLERTRTLVHARPLDQGAMQDAADRLLGLHDFAAFCRPRPFATTVRDLQRFRWDREPGGVLVADLRADAFCHSMVRSMVGFCLAVGVGRLDPTAADGLLTAQARANVFAVAPAHGLTLVEVGYPDDPGLAVQARRARSRREAAGARGSGYT